MAAMSKLTEIYSISVYILQCDLSMSNFANTRTFFLFIKKYNIISDRELPIKCNLPITRKVNIL